MYWFLTVQEFTDRFKMAPKAAGFNLDKCVDEEGIGELTGVYLRDDGSCELPYRKVKIFHRKTTSLMTTYSSKDRCLRREQANEVMDTVNLKAAKERGARLKRGSPAPAVNFADVQSIIEKARLKEREKMQAEADAEAEEQRSAGDADAADASGKEEDDDDEKSDDQESEHSDGDDDDDSVVVVATRKVAIVRV